jgi:hypothetical protein
MQKAINWPAQLSRRTKIFIRENPALESSDHVSYYLQAAILFLEYTKLSQNRENLKHRKEHSERRHLTAITDALDQIRKIILFHELVEV